MTTMTPLRQAMEERQIGKKQVSECAGIIWESLNHILSGRYNPRVVLALKLSRIIGKPVEELWGYLLDNRGFSIVPKINCDLMDPISIERVLSESGPSVSRIAKNAGVSPMTAYNILNGKRDVHLVTALKLSRYFGRSVEELWGDCLKEDQKTECSI